MDRQAGKLKICMFKIKKQGRKEGKETNKYKVRKERDQIKTERLK
jgi:hypothetical protein